MFVYSKGCISLTLYSALLVMFFHYLQFTQCSHLCLSTLYLVFFSYELPPLRISVSDSIIFRNPDRNTLWNMGLKLHSLSSVSSSGYNQLLESYAKTWARTHLKVKQFPNLSKMFFHKSFLDPSYDSITHLDICTRTYYHWNYRK